MYAFEFGARATACVDFIQIQIGSNSFGHRDKWRAGGRRGWREERQLIGYQSGIATTLRIKYSCRHFEDAHPNRGIDPIWYFPSLSTVF